ncbi:MAG: TRAP transporter substrate-binding protein DctP [Pseudomonadota bacterium]|nr:TRAP transporter substrate-binding protein DctP [Pseudomonadota bacterium]
MTKIAGPSFMAAAVAIALTATGPANAKTYKITMAAAPPPMVTFVAAFKNILSKKINARLKAAGKGDQIKWTHAYTQSLAKFHELFEAVEEGIAGGGLILKNFEPSNLPLEAFAAHTPFNNMTREQLSAIDTKLRTIIPELNGAYTKHNQIHIQSGVNDSMEMMTKFPLVKVTDLKGRKLGTSGTFGQWIRGTGSISVTSSMNQSYTNIKNGVYEGYPIGYILGFIYKTYSVAPYLTQVGFGVSNVSGLTFNLSTWKALPSYVQDIIRQEATKWPGYQNMMDNKKRAKFKSIMKKKGAKFSVLAAAERAKWAAAMPNIAKEWAGRLEKKGLPGNKLLKAYMDELRARNIKIARQWDKG